MKTYTVKEVSKIMNVSPSALKQWEKDLDGLLVIPRSNQGARLYTRSEIKQLEEINELYLNNLSKEEIREYLKLQLDDEVEDSVSISPAAETQLALVTEKEKVPSISNTSEDFFLAMDLYKQTFLNEVKAEIKKVVQTEVVKEVKKEINEGTKYTVKSISNEINKSTASTKEEIQELSETIQDASDTTSKAYNSLEKSLYNQAIETSEEFYTISKQLSETAEALGNYIDVTNNEIYSLSEVLEKDRDAYLEDREMYRQEIREREMAFQSMLASYRDAASAKEKKWWKFW